MQHSTAVTLISLVLCLALLAPAVSLAAESGVDSTVPGAAETAPEPEGGDSSGLEQETPPKDGSGEPEPGAGEEPQDPATITVTFMDGDKVLSEVEIPAGSPVTDIPAADAEGNPVLGWVSGGRKMNPAAAELTEDTVLSVWDAPALTSEHVPYVNGTGEGRFSPENFLTRAEAAALICNILADGSGETLNVSFPDVSSADWFFSSVTKLSSLGVITGRPDGTFAPADPVSRAEFVSMVHSMFPLETAYTVSFPDVDSTHWASAAILSAASKGWVSGGGDGLFNPDGTLTRAEAVTVLNSVLGRKATEETAQVLRNTASAPFLDVHPDDWYYAAVLEAFIPHTAEKNSQGEEHWLDFGYVSSGYEPGLQRIDDAFYLVDSNGQFTFYPAGIQTIGGKTYLFAEDGSIPGPGPQDTGDALYCVNEDGSLLMDGTFGYLYFGADGRYTSGDLQIDAEVEKALANCITPGMSREEKLRAAYCYVRDNCLYLGTATHYPRGYTTEWYVPGAMSMFTLGKGNCYAYTGAFLFLARRLGWQAYGISGGYREDNTDHAWVMIDDRIYDPCLEYLYPVRRGIYYDLYCVDPGNSPLVYWFP